MLYHSQQLENERWGIFINDQLVASIGCADTCQRIIGFLEARLENKAQPPSTAINSIIPYFHNMKLRP